MARLNMQAKDRQPLPGVEGCFVNDLPLGQIEELQQMDSGDPVAVLCWMGEHLLCDANGDKFEDLATPETVRSIPFSTYRDLNVAIRDYIDGISAGNE